MFPGASLEVKLVRSWNFPVTCRMSEHNIRFCLFSDLEQLAASFLATDIYRVHWEFSIQTALKFEKHGFEKC